MKKNLVSILILALTIVNITLTLIMMFSVTGAAKNTSALVGDIASILSLELESDEVADSEVLVPIENIILHNIEEVMIIPLKKDEDGQSHFVQLRTSFMLNSEHDDYSKYEEVIVDKDPIIKDAIIEVFSSKTISQVTDEQTGIKNEILENVQNIFGSDFIFDISFSEITPQ